MINKLLNDSKKLLDINTVTDKSTGKGAPFGEGLEEALNLCKEMCTNAGLNVYIDPDGYYMYADTPGEGSPKYGILGHIDVVTPGNLSDWMFDPFDATIHDGKLYGRGTQDMKVPVVMMINILEKLINDGIDFNSKIRLIIGVDEECEFRCMEKYEKENEFPPYGFTPDGLFGVVNVESHIFGYDVVDNEDIDFELVGGVSYNSVPDLCTYKGNDALKLYEYLTKNNVECKIDDDKLTVLGKSVHVCDIEKGINAISLTIDALYNCNIHSKITDYLYNGFGLTTDSFNINGLVEDKFSGRLVTNLGIINLKPGYQSAVFDIRVPILTDLNLFANIHKQYAQDYGLEYNQYFISPGAFTNKDSQFVSILLDNYEKHTGIKDSIKKTRGASYARVAKGYVSYGILFSDYDQKGLAHQVNEYVEIDSLKLAYKIYLDAITDLANT